MAIPVEVGTPFVQLAEVFHAMLEVPVQLVVCANDATEKHELIRKKKTCLAKFKVLQIIKCRGDKQLFIK